MRRDARALLLDVSESRDAVTAAHDVAILRAECDALKRELDRAGASD
jgi:hypothetical protein